MIFLTDENYYSPEANWEYMSVSQFKSFVDCPECAMAELRGDYKRPPSDAMLAGSYVDAWCEGTLDEFKESHPEIYDSRSKTEKKLKADFKQCEEIIESIRGDPYFSSFLEGQKQTIMTADMFGCRWKAKFDVYVPDERIVDMKLMKGIDDKFWLPDFRRYGSFVEGYKYNIQLNVYAMIEAIATGRERYLDRLIAVATKENPCRKMILDGFDQDMAFTQDYLAYYMPLFLKIKAGEIDPEPCGKCAYCRLTQPTIKQNYRNLIG